MSSERVEVSAGSIWYRFNGINSKDLPLILVLAAKKRSSDEKPAMCMCR